MTTSASAGLEPPRLRRFVGGAWTESQSDGWITDVNPSDTSDIVAYVPEGTADDAQHAARAAAQPSRTGRKCLRRRSPARLGNRLARREERSAAAWPFFATMPAKPYARW